MGWDGGRKEGREVEMELVMRELMLRGCVL